MSNQADDSVDAATAWKVDIDKKKGSTSAQAGALLSAQSSVSLKFTDIVSLLANVVGGNMGKYSNQHLL
ncbi:unnamed protein product [Ceratitis capitata]|uniref:(Mediterranean fruit fly) hypothetical protein n=1 Tax=Ceratitis capitata TaxID=7213 RepID=A0A811V2M1_CERCA|nr:unnamed protein product [Ceratitis capitata]